MIGLKKAAFVLAAVMVCGCFSSCGNAKDSSGDSSENSYEVSDESEIPAESSEQKSESSSDDSAVLLPSEGEVGELITPNEDDEEYELGSYRYSSNGVKLYYEDEEFSKELVLALEKYFNCFAEEDYETYETCLYPSYITEMSSYLEENYGYDLKTSFETQCESLQSNMEGSFKVTRVKAEKAEDIEDDEEAVKEFFSYLDDCFGKDYYSETSAEADKFDYLSFYVIAEGEDGVETLLISGFDIVFAEKDGKYYTFG